MKIKSPSQLRLISGIRTQRSTPILLHRQRSIPDPQVPQSQVAVAQQAQAPAEEAYGTDDEEEMVDLPASLRPETSAVTFKAIKYDKDYSFSYIQARWFRRNLYLGEQITITADELKMMCDESHEMGRLRERDLIKHQK